MRFYSCNVAASSANTVSAWVSSVRQESGWWSLFQAEPLNFSSAHFPDLGDQVWLNFFHPATSAPFQPLRTSTHTNLDLLTWRVTFLCGTWAKESSFWDVTLPLWNNASLQKQRESMQTLPQLSYVPFQFSVSLSKWIRGPSTNELSKYTSSTSWDMFMSSSQIPPNQYKLFFWSSLNLASWDFGPDLASITIILSKNLKILIFLVF